MKRRTMAKQICDNCRVAVNGHQAKPSREVNAGDVIDITVRSRFVKAKILLVPEKAIPASMADSLYEIIEERIVREDERDGNGGGAETTALAGGQDIRQGNKPEKSGKIR